MASTVLSVCQAVAAELGLQVPSQIVGSSDNTAIQLLALCNAEGRAEIDDFQWSQLLRTWTFNLVAGQSAYPLPPDFDRFVSDTNYDRSRRWAMIGPATPQEWERLQALNIVSAVGTQWRIQGISNNQMQIYPTPTAPLAGALFAFEYITGSWCRPKNWTSGATWTASSDGKYWCFYNGNYYFSATGGTTGVTAPVHTTGDASDGSITWTFSQDMYENALADTDQINLHFEPFKLGVKYRFQSANGLDFSVAKAESDAMIRVHKTKQTGASSLILQKPRRGFRLIDFNNLPDTGYGS